MKYFIAALFLLLLKFFIRMNEEDLCPKCGGKLVRWSSRKSYCEKCDYVG
jgi:hypothetical protein